MAVNPAGTLLSHAVYSEFMALDQGEKIQAEYIWIGGNGGDLRCKTMTMDKVPTDVSELRIWNYDGSSTNQAPGENSEVLLHPKAMYPDPFRGAPALWAAFDAACDNASASSAAVDALCAAVAARSALTLRAAASASAAACKASSTLASA